MYHIKAKSPMLIENEQPVYLQSSLDSINTETLDCVLKCYPLEEYYLGKKTLPNIIKLTSLVHNTQTIKVIKYPNNHTEILITPFTLDPSTIINEEKTSILNSKAMLNIDVFEKSSILKIKDNDKLFYHSLTFPAKSKKAIKLNNKYYIILENVLTNNSYILIAENGKIACKKISSLELLQNKITCLCPNNDMSKSATIFCITLGQKPMLEEKTVYINNNPGIVHDKKLIPYAFLEAVQINNFNLARHYITKEMSEKLSDNNIKAFFGNFINISQDCYNDALCLIYDKQECFEAKDYIFDFEDNKISNINEL